MKSINPLRTKVLITTDEVVFHAPIDNEPDVRILLQSIQVAENRFIRPALGEALYKAMCDRKNTLVTGDNKDALQTSVNEGRPDGRKPIVLHAGDYINSTDGLTASEKVLWADHLHKLTAECVYYCAMPSNHSRFSKGGITQDNPKTQVGTGGATSIDLRELKHLMDRTLQDRITPLLDAMHNYMCSVLYPGYTKHCACNQAAEPMGRKTDIMFGMYDDDYGCSPCSEAFSFPITAKTLPMNKEVILFSNESVIAIDWNSERRSRFGAGGVFQVEILGLDEVYRVTNVQISADNTNETLQYVISMAGPASGRIIIT